jgi:hypothetical protein
MYRSLGRDDINCILLDGLVISMYNIIDGKKVCQETGLPVIAITFEDSKGLEGAIKHHFPDGWQDKLRQYKMIGKRERVALKTGKPLYIRTWGITAKEAVSMLDAFTLQGAVPEPVKVAKIAARSAANSLILFFPSFFMANMQNAPDRAGWKELLNESVHTSDDQDIGDIEAVSRDFIVVKRGLLNVHRYYIPISRVEGWDGDVLWLNITEEQVKASYERNIEPDPYRYYIKDHPYYTSVDYPPLMMIPARYTPPAYSVTAREKVVYRCDICDREFTGANDVSEHVRTAH